MRRFKTNLSVIFLLLLAIACKEQQKETPFIVNGETIKTLIKNSLSGDENSKKIIDGLFTFDAELK
ncbi:MAG: hypothetical protein EHM44_08370, partial [Ignavibacteriales bacterium]